MNNFNQKYPLLSNTLESFKSLIGYNLSSCRVVFEYEGDEIVYINNFLVGGFRIYLNGRLARRGLDWYGTSWSGGWFLHKGKRYRIKCAITNVLTHAQILTLLVDHEVIESKADGAYANLTRKELTHLLFGYATIGVLVASVMKLFGI